MQHSFDESPRGSDPSCGGIAACGLRRPPAQRGQTAFDPTHRGRLGKPGVRRPKRVARVARGPRGKLRRLGVSASEACMAGRRAHDVRCVAADRGECGGSGRPHDPTTDRRNAGPGRGSRPGRPGRQPAVRPRARRAPTGTTASFAAHTRAGSKRSSPDERSSPDFGGGSRQRTPWDYPRLCRRSQHGPGCARCSPSRYWAPDDEPDHRGRTGCVARGCSGGSPRAAQASRARLVPRRDAAGGRSRCAAPVLASLARTMV